MNINDPNIKPASFDFDRFLEDKLDALKTNGSYRQFLTIEKDSNTFPRFMYLDAQGCKQEAVNWCTNDYLAMSTHPGNIARIISSSTVAGTGSGGTRNISGNTVYHQLLETKLASWHGQEKALVFNSAYQANQTALTSLGRHLPDLVFISDEENHASMIEGMRAVNNKKIVFRHNDLDHLEFVLNSLPETSPKIIVFESVYSISGSIAPLREIILLARKFNCLTYIDEVHAVGLYGPHGAGLLEANGLEDSATLINGTMSKAIGVFGGYLAGKEKWIDFIRSYGSGFIFTTSLPPAICAAALTSIEEIDSNSELRQNFFNNVNLLRSSLTDHGIPFTGQDTHITNIHIGEAKRCKQISDRLLKDYGIYLQPINQPTVVEGQECLRVTITPRHCPADIAALVQALHKVLKRKIILTGRGSRLSKVQLDLVKNKIKRCVPLVEVEIKYKESKGDQLSEIPLHTLEGSDFFTEDIFMDLSHGEADIAVHSLKDMSSDHFFGSNHFAVVDRDEKRDMAIFHPDIMNKLKSGVPIRIGTCSFRREHMAFSFLSKALPQFGKKINLAPMPIRGNIDTRLRKLNSGQYDGIILAVAGIHRMLNSDESMLFQSLLADKKWMVLPMIDCLPAPCQGAIVAEALPENELAVEVLNKINDLQLNVICTEEKRIGHQYGSGCIQKFGVSSFMIDHQTVYLAKGVAENGNEFEDWLGLNIPAVDIEPSDMVSSDELGYIPMRSYHPLDSTLLNNNNLFISHAASIDDIQISTLSGHRIWTAGTATWIKLAAKGLWVEGCADSLGFESIEALLKTQLVGVDPKEMLLLTNSKSAARWSEAGYQAFGTYEINYHSNLIDKYKLTAAKLVFWNCYAHYDAVKSILTSDQLHACLPGKTAEALRAQGIEPIIFPTINAFNQWKKDYSQAHYAA